MSAAQTSDFATPILPVLTAAIAPGLALLTYFYLKDRYDYEPIHLVIRVFIVGILIVFPIMIIQHGLVMWWGKNPFLFSFIISAGVEEFIKWFVLFHLIYNHVAFDEHYDGILYAVAVSLGFATIENILYAWFQYTSFFELLIRALLPVSGHALFGVIMGYYLGKAKFSQGNLTKRYIAFSIVIPIFWHGVYDILLLTVTRYWLWFVIPLMLFLWYFGMSKVRRATAGSPFRLIKREEEVKM
ncbi:glutamic-type intramembrane protease PrsW [Paenibacillus sp. 481]|uniref:glutamic-type intramembrane protease PrsW n=1 Tax=Paenibacillus sp. 481 TaxID=2835869 RepID=UPI001E518EAE|nr:glutamic-type intramembrane protease PrsW [Paenibacillus sp. 481]UHA76219.1 intramembrane metalloprotease PrsW [Paenibacillus sp. 481]